MLECLSYPEIDVELEENSDDDLGRGAMKGSAER